MPTEPLDAFHWCQGPGPSHLRWPVLSDRRGFPLPLGKTVGLSHIPQRLGGEFDVQFRTGNPIVISTRISLDRWAVQGETMRDQIETMSVNRTHYRHRTGSEDSQTPARNSDPIAVESRSDLASRHGSIVRIPAAHSWFYRSDNPICTRTRTAGRAERRGTAPCPAGARPRRRTARHRPSARGRAGPRGRLRRRTARPDGSAFGQTPSRRNPDALRLARRRLGPAHQPTPPARCAVRNTPSDCWNTTRAYHGCVFAGITSSGRIWEADQ